MKNTIQILSIPEEWNLNSKDWKIICKVIEDSFKVNENDTKQFDFIHIQYDPKIEWFYVFLDLIIIKEKKFTKKYINEMEKFLEGFIWGYASGLIRNFRK